LAKGSYLDSSNMQLQKWSFCLRAVQWTRTMRPKGSFCTMDSGVWVLLWYARKFHIHQYPLVPHTANTLYHPTNHQHSLAPPNLPPSSSSTTTPTIKTLTFVSCRSVNESGANVTQISPPRDYFASTLANFSKLPFYEDDQRLVWKKGDHHPGLYFMKGLHIKKSPTIAKIVDQWGINTSSKVGSDIAGLHNVEEEYIKSETRHVLGMDLHIAHLDGSRIVLGDTIAIFESDSELSDKVSFTFLGWFSHEGEHSFHQSEEYQKLTWNTGCIRKQLCSVVTVALLGGDVLSDLQIVCT
jgi:hypothetical protein